MEETSLCCPSCERDYELPRRTLKNLTDNDYSVLPRLLPCLHTVCQACIFQQMDSFFSANRGESKHQDDSCIERENDSKAALRNEITSRSKGNWESLDKESLSIALKRWNNTKASISCPICLEYFQANLPDNFPLDVVTLKKVSQVNTPIILAYCDRCASSIPSTSWCSTCFTPLCQFHHTDHELSSSTSSHDIYTYKELLRDGKHVNYRLPSAQCPHCIGEDCVLFCETCELLLSSRALLTGIHDGHKVEEVSLLLNEKRVSVQASLGQSQSYINKIENEEMKIRRMLKDLNKLEKDSIEEIEAKFNEIYKVMEQRKSSLIAKTKENIDKKRSTIEKNYEILSELGEDHKTIVNLGAGILKDTTSSSYRKAQVCIIPLKKKDEEAKEEESEEKNEEVVVKLTDLKYSESEKVTINDVIRDETREGMYLVASSSLLERKSDNLSEITDNLLYKVLPSVYNIKIDEIHFSPEDINFLKNIVHTIGGFKAKLTGGEAESQEEEDQNYTLSEEVVNSLLKSNKKIHFTVRLNNKMENKDSNRENKFVIYVWSIDQPDQIKVKSEMENSVKGTEALKTGDMYIENPTDRNIALAKPRIIGKINLVEKFRREELIKWKSVTYETIFENGVTEFKLFKFA